MLHEDPYKEKQIKKAVTRAGLEQPSRDFVHNVMQNIEEGKKTSVYRPLISGGAWRLIAGVIIGIVLLSFFTTENGWVVDLSIFSFLKTAISPSLWYSVGLILLLILVQIPLLKIYHNRKMSHM